MKKFLIGLFCIAVSVPAYSDALDNLKTSVNKKKTEKIEQERKEKARQEHLADCKQAIEKATTRKTEIEKELGKEIITSNLSGEIVDLAKNGIFVENNCYKKYKNAETMYMLNNFWGDVAYMNAANCEENRRFFYTDHTDYIIGQQYSPGKLVVYDGVYKYTTVAGSRNSVPAYKQTKYDKKEINYETYLQDKTNTDCPMNK